MTSRTILLVTIVALLSGTSGAAVQPASLQAEAVSPGASEIYALVGQGCPTFSWASSPDASAHELLVVGVPEGETALDDAIEQPRLRVRLPGRASNWTPSGADCFAAGERYAWLVRSESEESVGEWSPALFFRTPATPSPSEVAEALDVLQQYLTARGATAPGPLDTSAAAPASASPNDGNLSTATGVDRARLQSTRQQALAVAESTGIHANVGGTGVVFGVHGVASSSAAGTAAVVGESSAISGNVFGIYGQTASPGGSAGMFDATNGGDALRGRIGGLDVFAVDAAGVWTTGTVGTAGLVTLAGTNFFSVSGACQDNTHVTGVSSSGTVSCSPNSAVISDVLAGAGLSVTGSKGELTLAHADTSTLDAVNGSNGLVIQEMDLDAFGHLTQVKQVDLDARYFTESESLSTFVEAGGDAMTGPLSIIGGGDVKPGGGGYLTLGPTTGENVAIDSNEIMARNNGATANLYLQPEGGTVSVGTFNSDETLSVGGNIRVTGELRRPATGTSDMLPIVYGYVRGNGRIDSGSGNFTVTQEATGIYQVFVNNVVPGRNHVIMASATDSISPVSVQGSPTVVGYFKFRVWDLPLAIPADNGFYFVIYES